jgi:hypothetical protein
MIGPQGRVRSTRQAPAGTIQVRPLALDSQRLVFNLRPGKSPGKDLFVLFHKPQLYVNYDTPRSQTGYITIDFQSYFCKNVRYSLEWIKMMADPTKLKNLKKEGKNGRLEELPWSAALYANHPEAAPAGAFRH